MPQRAGLVCAVTVISLAACQPTLNWREVRASSAAASALLPCKAEVSSRQVVLGGHEVPMESLSCNAGEALFAITFAPLPPGASTGVALDHWRRTTLAHVKATDIEQNPPHGLTARAVRPTGGSLAVAAQWVARGPQLVQLAVYADNPQGKPVREILKPEMYEPFFGSLRWAP